MKGKAAEEEARRYLEKTDHQILATNLRAGGGEIDIVAEKGGILLFVEVKSRFSEDFGEPEEYVTIGKQKRIIRAAKLFCTRKPHRGKGVRFDVISVVTGSSPRRISHLENAFEE